MIAATDAKHYEVLTENVYRFFPARLDSEGLKKIHGSNEKILKSNYTRRSHLKIL
jgi:carboxypeptidase PM20D1